MEGWTEDWDEAVKLAKAEKKDLFIDFTGSDWCIWCQKLDAEVFSQPEFRDVAPTTFVLVKIDFPQRKPQTSELRARNEKLARTYQVEGYPTIVLADSEGKTYARTGYEEGGAKAYMDMISGFQAKKKKAYEFKDKADKATGLDKARYLDQFYMAMSENGSASSFAEIPDQIIKLDSPNEAKEGSLFQRYRIKKEFEEMKARWNDQTVFQNELGALDKLVVKATPSKDLLKKDPEASKALNTIAQDILIIKAALYYRVLDDKTKAVETLQAAKKLAPDSVNGLSIDGMIKTIQ